MLHHPLVISRVVKLDDVGRVNANYREKLRLSERAERDADWHQYVFLRERPYRLQALKPAVRSGVLHGAEYWKLLARVWLDSENIRQHLADWKRYWSSSEPDRHAAMSAEELEAYQRFPDPIVVYRGAGHPRAVRGLSWTLGREQAEWFARRFDVSRGGMLLATVQVRRDDVLAHFTSRGEREVVILPARLQRGTTAALD